MNNPFLDQMSKMMADGIQLTQGMRDEMQAAFKDQAEKFFTSLNLAHAEDIEILKARIDALEAKIDTLQPKTSPHIDGSGV